MNAKQASRGMGSLRSKQLAVLAKGVFDIPPRTRNLLVVAGICGIVIVLVASLEGSREQTVEIDKVLHFSGYAVLSFVFVLGLRPTLYIPALLGLIGLGFLIEELQPLNGRSRDVNDAIANSVGVAVGALSGLVIRAIYSYVRQEISVAGVRNRLKSYPPGATIMREGSRVRQFYIIKSGEVRVTQMVDNQPKELTTLGPGDVIGILAVIRGTTQIATVEATEPTVLYSMSLSELTDSAGGEQQPVSLVLTTFADKLVEAIDRINELESPGSGNSGAKI